MRKHYKTVFPEPEFEDIFSEDGKTVDSSRIFKIKYSANLLPQYGFYIAPNGEYVNMNIDLMKEFGQSEELSIFETESL